MTTELQKRMALETPQTTRMCSECHGDGSQERPYQLICGQRHPGPFRDEHGYYEKRRLPEEVPTCPPELMGPRPLTGVYCEDEEREDLEAEWLEEHPPGSACTSGCGYCGRCT